MGDTGALLLGLICSILTLRFVEVNKELLNLEAHPFATVAAPSVAIALLILTLTDTARVFLVRILRGKSPFVGDRLHIHHLLIDYGYTHTKATIILVLTSMTFMFLGFTFQSIGAGKLLILVLSLAFSFSFLLQNIVQKK
jgi:UDP-N-acetylmuramyl pentapeptide phosphotransferase/UDP-N-acetylglucosamine-1-phosphate transferase